jgi:hypothetical protein
MNGRGTPPKPNPFDPLIRTLRSQPPLVLGSYGCAFVGALLSVHDYHHLGARFGFSTPLLGAAIVLYLLGRGRKSRRPPKPKRTMPPSQPTPTAKKYSRSAWRILSSRWTRD